MHFLYFDKKKIVTVSGPDPRYTPWKSKTSRQAIHYTSRVWTNKWWIFCNVVKIVVKLEAANECWPYYKTVFTALIKWQNQKVCPGWGSNSRPSDYETDALPTALPRLHSFIHKKCDTHGGTRTPNLRFRRPTPYPLGHAGTLKYQIVLINNSKEEICVTTLKSASQFLTLSTSSPASSVGRAWDS